MYLRKHTCDEIREGYEEYNENAIETLFIQIFFFSR